MDRIRAIGTRVSIPSFSGLSKTAFRSWAAVPEIVETRSISPSISGEGSTWETQFFYYLFIFCVTIYRNWPSNRRPWRVEKGLGTFKTDR